MSNLHPFPGHPSAPPSNHAAQAVPALPLPFDPAMPPALRGRMLREALPEALQRLLDRGQVGRHSRFTDDGFAGVVEDWTPPDEVTPRHAVLARRVLAEIDDGILAPAPANHLLGRVLALLSHFPAKATTPEVEQLLAMDWADDLGEFPGWAIDQAARTWRRTRKWRPSIAEIRKLCEEACAAERALADRLRAIAAAGERAGDRAGERVGDRAEERAGEAGGHPATGPASLRPVLASAVRRMR